MSAGVLERAVEEDSWDSDSFSPTLELLDNVIRGYNASSAGVVGREELGDVAAETYVNITSRLQKIVCRTEIGICRSFLPKCTRFTSRDEHHRGSWNLFSQFYPFDGSGGQQCLALIRVFKWRKLFPLEHAAMLSYLGPILISNAQRPVA